MVCIPVYADRTERIAGSHTGCFKDEWRIVSAVVRTDIRPARQNLQSAEAGERATTAQNDVLTQQLDKQERHIKQLILALGQKIEDDD